MTCYSHFQALHLRGGFPRILRSGSPMKAATQQTLTVIQLVLCLSLLCTYVSKSRDVVQVSHSSSCVICDGQNTSAAPYPKTSLSTATDVPQHSELRSHLTPLSTHAVAILLKNGHLAGILKFLRILIGCRRQQRHALRQCSRSVVMKRHTAMVHLCPCRHVLRGHTCTQGNKAVRASQRSEERRVFHGGEEASTAVFLDTHFFMDVTLWVSTWRRFERSS